MATDFVLLLQMGGPASLDQVRPFLQALLSDPAVLRLPAPLRIPLARWIAWRRAPGVTAIYRDLGGGSPIGAISEAQARGLERELERLGIRAEVRVVMRYVPPRAGTVLREMAQAGARRVVLLPLYPQYSTTTTASSVAEIRHLLPRACPGAEVREIEDYPDHPLYAEALADQVRGVMVQVPQEERHRTVILWSAHGLPVRYVQRGDPYPDRVVRTVAAVEARLAVDGPLPRSRISWQSRVGPVRWLGPSTEEAVRDEAGRGTRSLVVVPVSFVSDHLETLHELDVLVRQVALEAGIRDYHRVPALNDHPLFLKALADLARNALDSGSRRRSSSG